MQDLHSKNIGSKTLHKKTWCIFFLTGRHVTTYDWTNPSGRYDPLPGFRPSRRYFSQYTVPRHQTPRLYYRPSWCLGPVGDPVSSTRRTGLQCRRPPSTSSSTGPGVSLGFRPWFRILRSNLRGHRGQMSIFDSKVSVSVFPVSIRDNKGWLLRFISCFWLFRDSSTVKLSEKRNTLLERDTEITNTGPIEVCHVKQSTPSETSIIYCYSVLTWPPPLSNEFDPNV